MRTSGRSVALGAFASLVACASLPCSPAGAQQLSRDRIHALAERQTFPALRMYRDFLSLPNDAHFPADIEKVVEWLEGAFHARGFATRRLPTAGSPLLFAERGSARAQRTVLFYLQADGQPVDPSQWRQESPYIPVLKQRTRDEAWEELPWDRLEGAWDEEWRIFGRSTSDSKGPIVQFLAALDALADANLLPDYTVKVIVDTEEEMGSPNLPEAVEGNRELLAADMLVILDGPPHYSNRPTLKFGARGIAQLTLTTYGPRVPQHSGHYGNYAPNPALRLAQILASMKDEHGRVTIPGFYEGVVLDADTRAALERVPDDEVELGRRLGITAIDSVGGNLQEAVQFPSLNIRGMSSGWVGSEARTIVPATATAEVDVRLVAESDPERLLALIRQHVEGLGYYVIDQAPTEEERLAHGKIATFTSSVSYLAFRTDFTSLPGRWLARAYEHLYGEEPIRIRTSGGSVPISPFIQTLGVPAVSVPTVNPDNNQHSPNENLRLGNFVEGVRVILAVLAQDFGGMEESGSGT